MWCGHGSDGGTVGEEEVCDGMVELIGGRKYCGVML